MEKEKKQLETTIESRDKEIAALKVIREETTTSLKNLELSLEEINKNQKRINSSLFTLKEQSVEIKDYLNITVPSAIGRLLNESRTGNSSDTPRK